MSEDSDIYIVCGRCNSEGLAFTARADTVEECNAIFRQHEQEVHNFKTGQEFYAKFEKELQKLLPEGVGLTSTYDLGTTEVLDAARRAAGME